MSYCINPRCEERKNQDHLTICSACQNSLLIQGKYRLLEPLRELDAQVNTEVFVVDAAGTSKVLKVLLNRRLLPMFKLEAQTLERLQHPGVPRVESDGYFTFELNNGREMHCLVMEKIEGQNLEQYLEQNGKICQDRAVDWLEQLVEILGMLHQKELFHRDIKLSNIMLKPDGQLALIDFGTVRQITNTFLAKLSSSSSSREVTSIVSPGYSPPEQIKGKGVPQSDFYALGCCFIHLLTGTHPLDFPDDRQTGKLIWYQGDPPVATWLADLINDTIAPLPFQRPLNTQEISERLKTEKTLPQLNKALKDSPQRQPSQRKLGLNLTRVLQLLNILLCVALLVVGLLRWHHKLQYWKPENKSDLMLRAAGNST